MSRYTSKKQKRYEGPPFIMLEKPILRSEAWLALSHAARVAYVHLMLQKYHISQTEVTLTYRAMKPIMEPRTFTKAIRQLEGVGLIEKHQIGGFQRKKNVFTFSQEWKKYRTDWFQKSKAQRAVLPMSQGAVLPMLTPSEQYLRGVNVQNSGISTKAQRAVLPPYIK